MKSLVGSGLRRPRAWGLKLSSEWGMYFLGGVSFLILNSRVAWGV